MLGNGPSFRLSQMVSGHKATDNVEPMYETAKQVAGNVHYAITSDEAANSAEAHRNLYACKNSLRKDSTHISHPYVMYCLESSSHPVRI